MIHLLTKFRTPRICPRVHFYHIQTQSLTKHSQGPRLVISQYANKHCLRPTNSRIRQFHFTQCTILKTKPLGHSPTA